MSLLKSLMAKQAGVKDESQTKKIETPPSKAQEHLESQDHNENQRGGGNAAAGSVQRSHSHNQTTSRRESSADHGNTGVGHDTEAAAPKTESSPSTGQEASTEVAVVAPKTPSKVGSLLGALRTQSIPTSTGSVGAMEAGTPSKDVAPVQPVKPASLLSGIAASRERAEKAKQDHSYLYDEIPKDFGETLKRFDQLMQRDQGDIDIDLPHMRDYVSRIMVDLKTNPEYNDLVHDGDVHNIIKFIRRTQSEARAIINQKIDKRARSESKPKAKNRFAMDLSSLDLGASPSDKPKSIQDLSDIDF